MLRTEIPVGGRLRFFIRHWEKITNDQWVLSILKNGYKLEFLKIPLFQGIRKTKISPENVDILKNEVDTLLQKDAIEKVSPKNSHSGFYSTFFVVPKKSGKMRPILNLRPLNQYLQKKHFKMDTLSKVLNLVKANDWAISLDLSDAYLHVPLFPEHRKYLRFCIQGQVYQWKVLCFGPTSAPRVFTKIMSVVVAHLRTLSIRLSAYLDDWFVLNQKNQMLVQDRETCLDLLLSLGFIINKSKSVLIPTQCIVHIGGMFQMRQAIVTPTPERISKIELAIQKLTQGQILARDYLHLLGLMASCIDLIPNARLYMRPIQLHLLSFWKPSKQSLDIKIPCTQHLVSHLQWWLQTANTLKGRSLRPIQANITITTDASLKGYGGHININQQVFQGVWTDKEKQLHINNLELEAVARTLKHYLNVIQGQNVLIRCDNTTVVQYINKQGGTKSPQMCFKTWDLWNWVLKHNIHMRAAHIAGKMNVLADHLSRVTIRQTEWTLNRQVVQQVFSRLGYPLVDLFASVDNRQTEIFCTWFPNNRALALDALTISWENMFAYAFPPLCLIPKLLSHMQQFRNCRLILIAPMWPRRHWYTEVLQNLVDFPIKLPIIPNLLSQPKTNIQHPNPEIFNLTAWLLSTEISEKKVFQKKLANYYKHRGEQVPRETIPVSLGNSVAGVLNGISIPIQHLFVK